MQERIATHSHKAQVPRHLAETQVALATALWGPLAAPATDGDDIDGQGPAGRARAVALVQRAADWYRASGAGYGARLRQIAAWRRVRGMVAADRTP